MNPLFLIFIGIPLIELIVIIKVSQNIGAFNTVLLVIFTAIAGIFFARLQGLSTLKSGLINIYQNKVPFYEILSGASIAIAAALLIIPGFITDIVGFLLLIPFTRKILLKTIIKNKNFETKQESKKNDVIEAEIIDEEDEKFK
tara:strand:+ start:2726 stop:3154 length:429 start_codon:yes stop_codon:yes gene_type:complete